MKACSFISKAEEAKIPIFFLYIYIYIYGRKKEIVEDIQYKHRSELQSMELLCHDKHYSKLHEEKLVMRKILSLTSVGLLTMLLVNYRRIGNRFSIMSETTFFCTPYTTVLVCIQSFVHCVRGPFVRGYSNQYMKLTAAPRPRMRGAIHLLPHTSLWHGA
jgi:hypothetical protein